MKNSSLRCTKISGLPPVSGPLRCTPRSQAEPPLFIGAVVLALRDLLSAPRCSVLLCRRAVTPSDRKHRVFRDLLGRTRRVPRASCTSVACVLLRRRLRRRLVSRDSMVAGSACVDYSFVPCHQKTLIRQDRCAVRPFTVLASDAGRLQD